MTPSGGIATAWFGLVLILGGLGSSTWAMGQLAEGVREIPQHWWSSLAVLPLLAGIAVTAVGLFRARRPAVSPAPD